VVNLSDQHEIDLAFTVEDYENGFGKVVELIAPDGVIYSVNQNDTTKLLSGRVDHAMVTRDPDTGEEFLVGNPTVSLRRSSLGRIPRAEEKGWFVRIPASVTDSTLVTYATDDRALLDDPQSGEIMLFLTKAVQQ
jgi:hypothetical protein